MQAASNQIPAVCTRYLRTLYVPSLSHISFFSRRIPNARTISSTVTSPQEKAKAHNVISVKETEVAEEAAVSSNGSTGAMSQRLEDMTEEAIASGNRRAIEDAGFSRELKAKLEARISDASFRSKHPQASSIILAPSGASRASIDTAAAQPWLGTESEADVVLRMLVDAHKPLKTPRTFKAPTPRGVPINTNIAGRAPKVSAGRRLESARDRSSTYSIAKDSTMTEKEREQMREELKDRFSSGARSMPVTLQGLSSLANERIEDAIARGQFKNLPRGQQIDRDYNASSPFIDTTEYLLNKLIQKQEIVPPWIEKQQELAKEVRVFRSRLRADWRRHAARSISSKGGTLSEQVRKAEGYAASELAENPKRLGQGFDNGTIEALAMKKPNNLPEVVEVGAPSTDTIDSGTLTPIAPPSRPLPLPFRDPAWEKAELAYHRLSITTINNLTRSYNLMAPDLAKKPYYKLERELRACFADVAPQLAHAICERARAPKIRVEKVGHRPGGVMERFSGEKAKVWDEKKPQYGFKEFWNDLWGVTQG